MTSTIMEEWLRWFDSRMAGRKVVLLMDNFSAHTAALQIINSTPLKLQNTLVIWLPPNSTSRYQPLDQGIIQAWKAHWKRHWIHFLLQEFEAGKDPLSTMNVLRAIRWGIEAWELNIPRSALQNCFKKAGFFNTNEEGQEQPLSVADIEADIRRDIHRLEENSYIQEAMDINNFVNPAEEVVQDSLDQIDEQILA